jgi:lipopolysaccharide biosynthesis glycosyltransferase
VLCAVSAFAAPAHAAHHSADQRLANATHALESPVCSNAARVDIEKKQVHVLIVLHGDGGHIEEASAALASMLHFRTCPLHVYMFTDDINKAKMAVTSPWNETHLWPHLDATYLPLPADITTVTRGIDHPFRSKYVLLKASMDRIIHDDIDHLVVTDTDLLWVGDVCDAESEIASWPEGALFGLAPEQYEYYNPSGSGAGVDLVVKLGGFPVPATNPHKVFGRIGLNAGIVLWRLAKAKQANWTHRWTEFIRGLDHPSPLVLADQDVFNRLGREHPDLIQVLPVGWNHQLLSGDLCDICVSPVVRVVHGNLGTLVTDPAMKRLWPHFARPSLETYKGHRWPRASHEERCRMRDTMASELRRGVYSCKGG